MARIIVMRIILFITLFFADKLAYEKQKSLDALKDMENIKNREV